jgi:hypothetical protein
MRGPRAAAWAVAGVVVFVIVDIALVWFAVASTRSAAAGAGAAEVLPTVAPRLATPAPSAPSPPAEPDVVVEPLVVALAAVDGAVAYRAETGPCPATPAVLEVSRDSGATWMPTAPAGASSIREVITDGSDVVSIVAGAPDDCATVLLRSFVQGDAWQVTEELATRWHLAEQGVVAPGGAVTSPCASPVQVAQRDAASAAVLCSDATLAVTTDAGASWAITVPIDGAASVAVAPDDYRLAVTGRDGCGGVQVVAVSPALEVGDPGGCLASDAANGATVLAIAGDSTVWVWSGGVVARSSDGGMTW